MLRIALWTLLVLLIASCNGSSVATAVVLADEVEVREFASWQAGSAVVETLREGDRVRVAGQLFVRPDSPYGWLLVPTRGWIYYEPDAIELDVDLAELPQVEVVVHPADARSGDPAVDAVIDAVLAGDAAKLAAIATLESRPCVGPTGDTGDVICPPGIDKGTTFEVFTFVACHGEPREASELTEEFARWFRATPLEGPPMNVGLWAVYRTAGGDYSVVFALDNGEARGLRVDDAGRIRFADRGCGPTPPEMFAGGRGSPGDRNVLMPPPER